MIKEALTGFTINLLTGFDDAVTHVPIISNITRTRKGKVAFGFGIFLAVTLAIILSFLFASILKSFEYYNYIAAGIIFLLAFSIYFDLLLPKSKEKTKAKIKKKIKRISLKRIVKLIGIGFITAFVTVIDDSLAYSSLFIISKSPLFLILGIYLATIIQIVAIIYFSKKISKIRYKKEASFLGLLIIGILILFRVI